MFLTCAPPQLLVTAARPRASLSRLRELMATMGTAVVYLNHSTSPWIFWGLPQLLNLSKWLLWSTSITQPLHGSSVDYLNYSTSPSHCCGLPQSLDLSKGLLLTTQNHSTSHGDCCELILTHEHENYSPVAGGASVDNSIQSTSPGDCCGPLQSLNLSKGLMCPIPLTKTCCFTHTWSTQNPLNDCTILCTVLKWPDKKRAAGSDIPHHKGIL